MRNRVCFILYSLVYITIVFLAIPSQIVWWYRLSFWLFAIFLLWVSRFWEKEQTELSKRGFWLLFIWTTGLLILIRIIPFIHFGQAPLGYDTGIYLRNFERAISEHLHDPLSIIVQVFTTAGFSVNTILHGFLAVFNILLGFALYTMSKSVFHNRLIAILTLLLFTLSIAQYEAYIWMFYRMMIALVLFMITTALIARGSYLAILTGGFAGALHPATFLVFGTAYVMYTMTMIIRQWWVARHNPSFHNPSQPPLTLRGGDDRDPPLKVRGGEGELWHTILTGLGILVLALLVNFPEFRGYITYLTDHKLQIASFGPYLSNELTGFYLNFGGFRLSTLFYAPFALLGIWRIAKNKSKTNGVIFLFSFLLTTLAFVLAMVVFYQRYLIIIDLLIIVFSSITLAQLIQYFMHIKAGRVLLSIFIIGFSGIIIYYSGTRAPWIPPAELQELKATALQLESNAYGMATDAYYTPWVYGYLTPRTIAPGYFINYWSLDEWNDFWYKGTDDKRNQLLARYDHDPIYIFVGTKQAENKPMRDFLGKYGKQISEHIWKY